MSEFSDRCILITGALGSLGSAQAELFGGLRPKTLLLLDRPDLPGAERAAELARRGECACHYVGHDLDDLEGTERLMGSLAERHGGIDVVVTNAALIINKPFEEFSIAEYEAQLRVNAAAAFAIVRGLAPSMKAKRYGRVVTFTSLTLNGRWDGYVPYVASKGAVLGLTRSLARELGPWGIRVNAVSPGAVVSEAEKRVFADRLEAYNNWILENQSLKERIRPEDVADLVHFLASDRSRMISGQDIGINGGW
jgi:NAD(P)-dependent dehydrogenase (short-subunit alcohol dehydrogenase family)